jgi:hypothetical protein
MLIFTCDLLTSLPIQGGAKWENYPNWSDLSWSDCLSMPYGSIPCLYYTCCCFKFKINPSFNKSFNFIITITLYVSVSFDNHQLCMNRTMKTYVFMLIYVSKRPCHSSSVFFNRLVGGGVQFGPLGTAATDWLIVPASGWRILVEWRLVHHKSHLTRPGFELDSAGLHSPLCELKNDVSKRPERAQLV